MVYGIFNGMCVESTEKCTSMTYHIWYMVGLLVSTSSNPMYQNHTDDIKPTERQYTGVSATYTRVEK